MLLDFVVPDAGPGKLPYACSYHLLRLPDDRMLVLDVVRSEDLGKLCLRALVLAPGRAPDALLVEAPLADWSPFCTTAPGDLDRTRNVLGRNRGWVAGSVAGAGPTIQRVAFSLEITVESIGLPTDRLGLAFLHLTVQDYTRVRYRGHVEIDGERHAIDAPGIASVHLGQRLARYAYVATAPPREGDAGPQILLAAVDRDDFKIGGDLLGDRAATYYYGSGGVPPVALLFGAFTHPISLGPLHALALDDIHVLPHTFLGEPTVTGLARAHLVRPDPGLRPDQWLRQGTLDLGHLLVEGHGAAFAALLTPTA